MKGKHMAQKEVNVTVDDKFKKFFNSLNLPPKITFRSNKPSKVQESPYDTRSPQDVLAKHNMYREPSAYSKNPQKFYADLTALGDYETNLNLIRRAEEKFDALGPDIKAKFNNSVTEFAKRAMSPDFNIEEILSPDDIKKHRAYIQEQKNKEVYENYLKSDKYKEDQAEEAYRRAYEKERYEAWKRDYIAHKNKTL